MGSFHEYMMEYRKQVEKGAVKEAYRGLMEYFASLKSYFQKKYPDFLAGNIYFGYMDMTYFPLFPEPLRRRKLKIAVVFLHEAFRFEVWLAGANRKVQAKYWQLIKDSGWSKYRLPSTTKGADSIVEYTLVDDPDFRDLGALTGQIEKGTLTFIKDVEEFLSEHKI